MAHDRIDTDPNVMLGKPVIRGTRITVEQVVRECARGLNVSEVAGHYPRLTEPDVLAALAFAADYLGNDTPLAAEQMRLPADECCPRRLAGRLREAGMDVRQTAEPGTASTDQKLLAIASAERRIIVTEDFDFGDLVSRDGMRAPGIVIVFLPAQTPDDRAGRLLRTLQTPSLIFAEKLTIISPQRIRQRPLPET